MAEAAPHHLELIDQLLVQGTHFWMHQLLMHGQPDSQDVDLQRDQQGASESVSSLLSAPHLIYSCWLQCLLLVWRHRQAKHCINMASPAPASGL